MLTARGERRCCRSRSPARSPSEAWFDELLRAHRPHRPAHAPPGRALGRPAAARRDRARARLAARPSSSPTSRPATSTRRRAARSSSCCAHSVDEYGQTMVMVTHDPRAAAIADRVLFLADGLIVNEHPRARSQHDILARDGSAERRVIRFAAQGPARPQAAHRADRDRDRARRRDGQRDVRPHRLDRRARSTRSSRSSLREHRRGDHRQGRLRPRRRAARRRAPPFPESRARARCKALPDVDGRDRRRRRRGPADRRERQGDRRSAAPRTSASASTRPQPRVQLAHARRAAPGRRTARS